MGFEGGACQKNGFKGGARQKIWCVKGGGHQKKLPLSLVMTASVIMHTSVPECQKIAFLTFSENSNFPGGASMPPDTPTSGCHGNSTPPTISLQNTARGMSTLSGPLLVYS